MKRTDIDLRRVAWLARLKGLSPRQLSLQAGLSEKFLNDHRGRNLSRRRKGILLDNALKIAETLGVAISEITYDDRSGWQICPSRGEIDLLADNSQFSASIFAGSSLMPRLLIGRTKNSTPVFIKIESDAIWATIQKEVAETTSLQRWNWVHLVETYTLIVSRAKEKEDFVTSNPKKVRRILQLVKHLWEESARDRVGPLADPITFLKIFLIFAPLPYEQIPHLLENCSDLLKQNAPVWPSQAMQR